MLATKLPNPSIERVILYAIPLNVLITALRHVFFEKRILVKVCIFHIDFISNANNHFYSL
jgi:hypothetical protein